MKYAVLTRYGSHFGIQLLELLSFKPPELVVIEQLGWKKRFQMAKFLAKKTGAVNSLVYNFKFWSPLIKNKITLGNWYKPTDYSQYAQKIVEVTDINNLESEAALKDLNPDFILLGQSGIIKENIFSIPKLGTFNSHPGILPFYRGVDVYYWSMYHGYLPGVSLHYVDRTVDTGNIIQREQLVVSGKEKFKEIETMLINKNISMLVELVKTESFNFNKIVQDQKAGKQYYLMPYFLKKRFLKEWEQRITPLQKKLKGMELTMHFQPFNQLNWCPTKAS